MKASSSILTNNVVGVVTVAVAAVVVIDIVVVAVGVVVVPVVPVVDNPFCGLFRLRRLGRFNVCAVVDNVVIVVVVFSVFGSVVITSIISMVVAVGEVNWIVFKGAGDIVNVEEDWVFVADAVSVTVVGIGLKSG